MTERKDRPRVLFVGAFPPPGAAIYGGAVTACSVLLGSSLPSRVALTLVDSTQISQPPPGLGKRLWLAILRCLTYVRLFERERPDAVLLFMAAGASVAEKGAMAWYAKLRGVPALISPRGGPVIDDCRASRFARAWTRIAFRGGATILCQGEAWREFAVNEMGFEVEATRIVTNAIATEQLLEIGRRRTYDADIVNLLFVGWLDREKGIAEFLDAVRTLSATRKFVVTLVGEGNMTTEAQRFIECHDLGQHIALRGWRQDGELLAEYRSADVFVLPSWSEGLPNAMLEAMSTGLPVVVSAVGNIPDAVDDDMTGLLVPPRDVDALQTALARVIDDADLRRRIGSAAQMVAADRFAVEPVVDALVAAIHETIERFDQPNRQSVSARN